MPQFSFGHYNVLHNQIIEIVASEGMKLDMPQAQECLDLYAQQGDRLGILVNRQNKYMSSLEFIMAVAEAPQVSAFAILVESELAASVARSQEMFFEVPFEIFFERESALNWLKRQLQESSL